jgi:hypothetical protein
MESDKAPDNLAIGAINPFALAEAVLGTKIDWTLPQSATLLSDTLQTDYDVILT